MSALTPRQAASEIANAFQSAAPDVWAMSKAASGVVDADGELFDRLARDVVLQFGARLAVMHVSEIAAYLYSDRWLHVAFDLYEDDDAEGAETDFQPALRVPKRKGFILPAATQRPPHFPIPAYNLPRIDNVNDLATLLGVHLQRLDAWTRRFRPSPQHRPSFDAYFGYWRAKASGGARLIEHPKSDLKHAQRFLLRKLLSKIDPHEAAHGFVRGHSILTHARIHAGRSWVMRCDVKDFFPSVRASRIHAIFRYLGYNESVAHALAMLTTTRATSRMAGEGKKFGVDINTIKHYQCDHLPQGAPTSPALANLAAFKLDLRLNALAEQWGVNYSRYADDLTFSGDSSDVVKSVVKRERFYLRIAAIAIEEGFSLNMRKTRWMHASQRQEVTGLTVNAKPNIARKEFDRLKAILTNAARHGLESQNHERHTNFRAQLIGEIAFVQQVSAHRGQKLADILARVRT